MVFDKPEDTGKRVRRNMFRGECAFKDMRVRHECAVAISVVIHINSTISTEKHSRQRVVSYIQSTFGYAIIIV